MTCFIIYNAISKNTIRAKNQLPNFKLPKMRDRGASRKQASATFHRQFMQVTMYKIYNILASMEMMGVGCTCGVDLEIEWSSMK